VQSKKGLEFGIDTVLETCPHGHSRVVDVQPYVREVEIFEDSTDGKHRVQSSASKYADGWERIWGKKAEDNLN
jgi:hypothetical protein